MGLGCDGDIRTAQAVDDKAQVQPRSLFWFFSSTSFLKDGCQNIFLNANENCLTKDANQKLATSTVSG